MTGMLEDLVRLVGEGILTAGRSLSAKWRRREEPQEGAIWRGWKDARRLSGHWFYFRIPAAAVTAGFAVWSALLPAKASSVERAALAVGGTLGGALVVGLIAFAVSTAAAPVRQRNELRRPLTLEARGRAALAEDLAGFMAKVRAARPAAKTQTIIDMFDREALRQSTREQNELATALDRWRRDALVEYHDRYRPAVVALLRDAGSSEIAKAQEPDDVGQLEDVVAAVKGAGEVNGLTLERQRASDAARRAADEIQAHHDAREAEEPPSPRDPFGGGSLGALQRQMRGEYDVVTAYRRATLALYYRNHRATAGAAYREALRLHAGQSDRLATVEKPGDLDGLLTVASYLREAADELGS